MLVMLFATVALTREVDDRKGEKGIKKRKKKRIIMENEENVKYIYMTSITL